MNISSELKNPSDFVSNRIEYYRLLQTKIQKLCDIKKTDATLFDDYLDISPLNELEDHGSDMIGFNMRRVGRIQEGYALFLNKLFFDHKSRIAANTIRNVSYHYSKKLAVSVLGFDHCQNIEKFCIYYDRNAKKNYILKSDLINSLNNNFIEIVDLIQEDRIYVKKHNQYQLCEDTDDLRLTLNLPISYTKDGSTGYIDELKINKIFRSGSPGGGEFKETCGKKVSLSDNFSIETLHTGISNNKYSISLDGYCIKVTE